MNRFFWRQRIEQLDPATDYHEIYRIMVAHEFPWDMNQALSFALFRTYAVPSIGSLLARTGEFIARTQQRYDDTTLILDAVLEHGFGSIPAREAFRRMNQMHGAYPISNDDLRYVLSTFVVVPMRWLDSYGWRRLTETEKAASANYYHALGKHMNIKSIPATYPEFIALTDAYERERFAFDAAARAVAESTLNLLATFPPSNKLPAGLVRRTSYAIMDDPLLDAFGFPRPNPVFRALVRAGLVARGRFVRFLPPRKQPRYARELPNVRSYPNGYQIGLLGTFPTGPDSPEQGPQRATQPTTPSVIPDKSPVVPDK
jgi:ER-bound oxygenase mpaB/B'/Rubber oxygenase, catalytic domain